MKNEVSVEIVKLAPRKLAACDEATLFPGIGVGGQKAHRA